MAEVTLDDVANMNSCEVALYRQAGVEAVRAYRALCNGSSSGAQLLAILSRRGVQKEVSPATGVVGKRP